MKRRDYTVLCNNIGTVYRGHNKAEAMKVFKEYVEQSEKSIGRASGESVFCYMVDGFACVDIAEHIGTVDRVE